MAEVTEELKDQIVEFFKQKNKMMTHRDVAKGLDIDNRTAKKALVELVNAVPWSSRLSEELRSSNSPKNRRQQ